MAEELFSFETASLHATSSLSKGDISLKSGHFIISNHDTSLFRMLMVLMWCFCTCAYDEHMSLTITAALRMIGRVTRQIRLELTSMKWKIPLERRYVHHLIMLIYRV